MKLTPAIMHDLEQKQAEFRLSAAQMVHYVAKHYGVKVTRQAVFKRLNAT